MADQPSVPKRSAKPLIVTGLAFFAAAITALVAWSSAAFAAWQTALRPQTRTMTLQEAREQYQLAITISKASAAAALLLLLLLAFLFWRRARSKAPAPKDANGDAA